MNSGFEYFAGGGLKKVTGNDKDKTSLYDLAEAAGYKVTYTQAEAEAITASDQKVILIDEHAAQFRSCASRPTMTSKAACGSRLTKVGSVSD